MGEDIRPDLSGARAAEAGAQLRRELRGDVRVDAYTRHLFATDASMYAREPLVVAFPRDAADVAAAVAVANRLELPLVTRGAGTSLSGQTIGRRSCSTRRATWTRSTSSTCGRGARESGRGWCRRT